MFLLIIIVAITLLICAGIYFFNAPILNTHGKPYEELVAEKRGEYDAKEELGI